jgi:hypothetical protein
MRVNAKKAIEAFTAGRAACGDSKRTIWTDGQRLFSYNMTIALRTATGRTVAIVAYEDGPSRTTKSHIRAAQVSFPDAIVLPPRLSYAAGWQSDISDIVGTQYK